jgi:hypothetical protein
MKMELTENSVEDVVREVLSQHYPAFAADPKDLFVADIVTLLDDPSKRYVDCCSGFESDAAYEIRMLLLKTFAQGANSVKSVVRIFNNLERGQELGWLDD